jgi:hypothetical protein
MEMVASIMKQIHLKPFLSIGHDSVSAIINAIYTMGKETAYGTRPAVRTPNLAKAIPSEGVYTESL